ncbi:FixH family protein [Pseudothauera rhizosphaerae]|uniref:Nitrogen fixation protein FixH n=1 Tax=Pseudothauera rhizosphaerae TaxID=2565932 RepID=A0A4S4AWW0_9RHOO|nr:FixH family protein [Pseudothauera rhizosphaerae]THF64387.1 nitrogen fixation protein FixH [Pseudothauera rhizosphaerae]
MNTSSTTPLAKPEPWFKQFWPWFLLAIPGASILAGIVFLTISIKSWDGLVVDDYYKEGRAIVMTIDRLALAGKLGLSAGVRVYEDRIVVDLSAADTTSIPEVIHLTIAHPTRGGMDQELLLRRHGGSFTGVIQPLHAGRWLFQIEDESRSWRMNGAAYLPTETEIRIDPSAS